VQLDYLNLVRDNWGFASLVKGVIEHLNSIMMELVRKVRPAEGERHEKIVIT